MAVNLKPGYDQIKHLLTSTVTLLCKNGVPFSQKLHVEALVGVTVDQNDVFFVHISETIPSEKQPPSRENSPAGRGHHDATPNKIPPQVAKVHRSGPPPQGGSRTHSPVGFPPSPRCSSPATVRQLKNGTMAMAQQQQQQQQQLMFQQQQQQQRGPQLQQRQQRTDFTMGGRPSPQQSRSNSDCDDVVIVKQERLLPADVLSQQAAMAAQAVMGTGRRRAAPYPAASNVTVIEPVVDPSLDDTEAMQKSYLAATQGNPATPTTEQDLTGDPPPSKRLCMDSGNSNSSFRSDRSPPTDTSMGMHFSGQWAVGDSPIPPHPVTYSDPPSRTIQAYPGCSDWPSPIGLHMNTSSTDMALRNQSPRGFKNPRNNTMCQPVRDVLEFSLAQPVLAEAKEVSAFRLFWRGHDTIAGWRNIIYNRLELDAIVAEYPGVSFFVSAITATARDPKTITPNMSDARLRAYPALGYWIATRDPTFDRHQLMKKLSDAAEGGELKTMLQNDGEKVNEVGALNLIVKDYGKGYVQQRVSESALVCCGPDEEHPTIRFILKEDHFEEKLRETVDLLSGVGCPVSLEKVDLEELTAEDEDGEAPETEQQPELQEKSTEVELQVAMEGIEEVDSQADTPNRPRPNVKTEKIEQEVQDKATEETEDEGISEHASSNGTGPKMKREGLHEQEEIPESEQQEERKDDDMTPGDASVNQQSEISQEIEDPGGETELQDKEGEQVLSGNVQDSRGEALEEESTETEPPSGGDV